MTLKVLRILQNRFTPLFSTPNTVDASGFKDTKNTKKLQVTFFKIVTHE